VSCPHQPGHFHSSSPLKPMSRYQINGEIIQKSHEHRSTVGDGDHKSVYRESLLEKGARLFVVIRDNDVMVIVHERRQQDLNGGQNRLLDIAVAHPLRERSVVPQIFCIQPRRMGKPPCATCFSYLMAA